MPRYFFHLVSREHVVHDDHGVLLEELSAAHWYGLKLQHQIREYSQQPECVWTVKITDDSGGTPLIILPRPGAGPVARSAWGI
ncbi:MAG TPA: hypothetical protein VGD13_04920 [Xanthobacteraceae bacterium]|jgi:hypothetical protein